MALDSFGQIFIVDSANNRIRKVDTNGVISTVAGGGSGGDGGPATGASLNNPNAVALDAFGNLFIADTANDRIRMVGTNGIITTVAGNGNPLKYGGDGGAPTNASFGYPYGVALDAVGNVYIGDQSFNFVRKALFYAGYPNFTVSDVSPTNAGNYSVVISNSYGCATSAAATLTVEAPPVITIQPASQMVLPGVSPVLNVTAAGSGPFEYLWCFEVTNLLQSGTSGTLTIPGFASANAGSYTVVVTNAYGSVTSQVVTLTAVYAPSVTAPPASQTVLPGPNVTFNVAAEGTGPFTYQWQFNGNNVPNNTITTVAGNGTNGYSGDGGPATNASLHSAEGMAVDALGNLYFADEGNNRIRKVNTNGIISTFAGNGTNGFSGDGGTATNANVTGPGGVALDANGNVYISDGGNSRIREVGKNGIINTLAGDAYSMCYWGDGGPATYASLFGPFGVALDAFGNLYIADTENSVVRMVGTNGIIATVAGISPSHSACSGDGGPATNACMLSPFGVAVESGRQPIYC